MAKRKQEIDEITGLPPRPFTQLDTSFNGIIETTPPDVKRRLDAAVRRAKEQNARRAAKAKKRSTR